MSTTMGWENFLTLINSKDIPVEFVSQIQNSQDITKRIVSLANSDGGNIIVGFDRQNYQLHGINFDLNWLKAAIFNECKPEITPVYHQLIRNGKQILILEIEEGLAKPYSVNEKSYIEVDNSIKELSSDDATKLDSYRDMGISTREKKALEFIKKQGSLTNTNYRDINSVSHKTAHNELSRLNKMGLIHQIGTGRKTKYMLADGDFTIESDDENGKESDKTHNENQSSDDIIDLNAKSAAVAISDKPTVVDFKALKEELDNEIEDVIEEIEEEAEQIKNSDPKAEDTEPPLPENKDYESKIQNLFGEDIDSLISKENPTVTITDVRKSRVEEFESRTDN